MHTLVVSVTDPAKYKPQGEMELAKVYKHVRKGQIVVVKSGSDKSAFETWERTRDYLAMDELRHMSADEVKYVLSALFDDLDKGGWFDPDIAERFAKESETARSFLYEIQWAISGRVGREYRYPMKA